MEPGEQEAVRTTIVGGRPPGSGRANGAIPRGIEILTKKAAVDAAFRALLLSDRLGAARSIGLELTPAEAAMLRVVPQVQLEAIINCTRVQKKVLPAFLGGSAAAMLVALSTLGGCEPRSYSAGIDPAEPAKEPPGVVQPTEVTEPRAMAGERIDVPPVTEGIRPDIPIAQGVRPDVPAPAPAPGQSPEESKEASPAASEAPAAEKAFESVEAEIKALVEQLGHRQYEVRSKAEKRLVEIGKAAEPALQEAAPERRPGGQLSGQTGVGRHRRDAAGGSRTSAHAYWRAG